MGASLRRAIELAMGQIDLPLGERLEATGGLPESETVNFVRAVRHSDITARSVESGQILWERGADLAADKDEPYAEHCDALIDVLNGLDAETTGPAWSTLLHDVAAMGVTEGFLLGVIYTVEKQAASAERVRNRPRR